jgi:N-methylhydantoinase A
VRTADGRTLEAKQIAAAAFTGEVAGPALIEGYSSTAWVPEGWSAGRDTAGNLILRRAA